MLLIPDIHINSRMRESIIDELRRLVVDNADEKSVVFLGDYVYHFAYDRKSLLLLFRFFVELYHQGKDVYVLAGNHDWITEQFVYEEGKMATEMMMLASGSSQEKGKGMLKFITEVEACEIDSEKVLFLPYTIQDNEIGESKEKEKGEIISNAVLQNIQVTIDELLHSKNKGERKSGRVNSILLEQLLSFDLESDKPLLVIHHYYLEGVQFPGQRGRFGFKDVALDRRFAEIKGINLISGHIHQPFVHHNYLCMGSLRATSPLEINHYKVAGIYHDGEMEILPLTINAYMRIENDNSTTSVIVSTDGVPLVDAPIKKVDQKTLLVEQNKRWHELQDNMSSNPFRTIKFGEQKLYDHKAIKLQLIVEKVDYNVMDDYIDVDLQVEVGDIQLKKKGTGIDALVEKMSLADKNLREGFADWKEVLKLYLSQKYGAEEEDYLEILRDLKLL